MNTVIVDSPAHGPEQSPILLLAHGAGAGQDSSFMACLAGALARAGVTTIRFEFLYMQKSRQDGRRRPPDRQPALLSHFNQRIGEARARFGDSRRLFIGGKSMGGRMASLLAADADLDRQVRGAVCFGYPFHPPGKPDNWRTDHFSEFRVPVAICQGTRDPFGKPLEVADHPEAGAATLYWQEGGDHDLRPLKRQGLDEDDLIRQAATRAAEFIAAIR